MKRSELVAAVDHKPKCMECCVECKPGEKDCEPNPLHCVDFCIANHDKLIELGFDLGF